MSFTPGQSENDDGAVATTGSSSKSGLFGRNNSTSAADAPGGSGVFGLTVAPGAAGVFGANNGTGKGRGVQGNGPEAGVGGFSDAGSGVVAQSNKGSGVLATSARGQGVTVFSDNDIAVFAQGATFAGVFNGALVVNKGPDPKDATIKPSNINGSIVINDGNLFVNKGDVILGNADCAEDFTVAEGAKLEPGTVAVLDETGALRASMRAYDKSAVGVVSGAGCYRPALILDRQPPASGKQEIPRAPLALIGKVYCKADADYAPIEVGDLLTTSSTEGHAMKATATGPAFGAVIGKALAPLSGGRGLIPILVVRH
jgi:hypothetical protein